MCQSSSNQSEGYLAGLVSRGHCGAVNFPSFATNVVRHLEWITSIRRSELNQSLTIIPKRTCSKCMQCTSGARDTKEEHRRCDRVVDCYQAEDEIECDYTSSDSKYFVCLAYR